MQVSRRQQLVDAFRAGQVATVVALADLVLEANADDAPVLAMVGYVQSVLCQYENAKQRLERALRLFPDGHRHMLFGQLGNLYRNKGELTTAVRYYEDASRLRPDDAGYHIFRGCVLAQLGRLTDSEAAFRMATNCSEGCIDEAYHNLGINLRSQRRLKEARRCFEQAIELDPEDQGAKIALQDVIKALVIVDETDTEQSVGHAAADNVDSESSLITDMRSFKLALPPKTSTTTTSSAPSEISQKREDLA